MRQLILSGALAAEELLAMPELGLEGRGRGGLGRRGRWVLNVLSVLVLATLGAGWTWTLAQSLRDGDGADGGRARPSIGRALTAPDAPTAAFVTDAALEALVPLRGESGKLRATIVPAGTEIAVDSMPAGAAIAVTGGAAGDTAVGGTRAERPGLWGLAVKVGSALKPVSNFTVITMLPLEAKRNGRVGLYYIGSWPNETGANKNPKYAPPPGFIEVTRENQNTYVSEHFRLRDFLTHDQQGVWPKYLVLDQRLLDKLELVLSDLESRGISTKRAVVMSGFRTPQYNAGGGETGGRASLSRHMYGDAADVFIDADGDGVMDDLNRDGRVTIEDSRVILESVERVERQYPHLIGGCGVYKAAAGHGPFTHVDVRGYRARW